MRVCHPLMLAVGVTIVGCVGAGDDVDEDLSGTAGESSETGGEPSETGGESPLPGDDRCPDDPTPSLAERESTISLVMATEEPWWQFQALTVDGDDVLAGLVVLQQGEPGALVRFPGGEGPHSIVAAFPTVARVSTIAPEADGIYIKAVRGGIEGHVWVFRDGAFETLFMEEMNGFQPMLVHPDYLVVQDYDGNIEVVARIPNESRSITGWTVGTNVVFVALGDGPNTGELWRVDVTPP